MRIRFQLMGQVRLETDQHAVAIRSAPVRGVLASLLLYEGRFIPVDQLVLLLWDVPPKSAFSNLRLHVARLRNQLVQVSPQLGECLITLRGNNGGGYGLRIDSDTIDATRFRRLAARGGTELQNGAFDAACQTLTSALELWHGPMGQDCTASSQLRSRFDAIEQLHLAVRERLVEAKIGLGRTIDLIPDIQDILSAAPLREASWMNLVRAHYLGGDISGAFHAWERATSTISDELGLELSREFHTLRFSMLRRDCKAVMRHSFATQASRHR